MSERIQRVAKERADSARKREQKARERARRHEHNGQQGHARVHQVSAELQADAAKHAESVIGLDQEIEGDRLGDSDA